MSDNNDLVIIELDRPREIRFGHKAIKMIGAMTGKDIDAALSMEDLDLEVVEKILYCGLISDARDNGEELRLEDMEDLLDKARPFSLLIQKMQQAFDSAFSGLEGIAGAAQQGNQKPNRSQRRSAGRKA